MGSEPVAAPPALRDAGRLVQQGVIVRPHWTVDPCSSRPINSLNRALCFQEYIRIFMAVILYFQGAGGQGGQECRELVYLLVRFQSYLHLMTEI